ncbi:helix-turn-helix domain-containing protein [Halalkalibacter urbisdiaboli]|uniref:helix-turn-helix domain-containing protein n=1 Tax=Halalkalibacter urbisdiaboli TaxID=1960589 RepID=UPI000B4324FB|nr:helix-turn-helix transcriptional regulator [Halalkalibacter urbisdiaboli]
MSILGQLNQSVGKNIKARRLQNGLTLEKLAEDADLSVNYIGQVERGEKNITIYTLFRIAKGLHLKKPHELLLEASEDIYPNLHMNKEKD